MQSRFDCVVDPIASQYRILFSRLALKNFDKLNNELLRNRINKRIEQLAISPYPLNCKKLKAFNNRWEIPCGSYRIWYEPHCSARKIEIIWIGHHQDDFHKPNFMKRVA